MLSSASPEATVDRSVKQRHKKIILEKKYY
jgi:hypothetical protein